MTQDEIIDMWKNSGDLEIIGMPYNKIEAFAKLVASKVEELLTEQHMTDIHQAIKIEREACCKAIDEIDDGEAPEYRACQEAIRARGY